MKKFIKKWNQQAVEDWGGITSDSFKNFARELRSAIKSELKKINSQVELVQFSIGHYYVSGFIRENGKYVYFSYDCPRGDNPMDLEADECMSGWLYRTAEHSSDYSGRMNHFCKTIDLVPKMVELLER